MLLVDFQHFLKFVPDLGKNVDNSNTTRREPGAAAEAEVAELKKQFRRGVDISSREKELEMQVVQDNADREVLLLELEALKKRHKSAIRDNSTKFDQWVAAHQGETQKMITEMVEAFEEELSSARHRSERAESLLADATRDLEYLMEENDHLRTQLNHK